MTMEKHGGQTNDNNNNQKREDIDVSFCPTEFGVVLNVVMFKKSIKNFRAQQCCSSPGFGDLHLVHVISLNTIDGLVSGFGAGISLTSCQPPRRRGRRR